MPSDQHGPSCPSCGEPVGTRATYCMHCGTEFTAAERDGVAGAADEADATDFRDAGEEFIDDLVSGDDTGDASTGDTAFGDTASGDTPDTPTVEEPDTTPTVDGETGALAVDSDSGGEATAVGQPESAETGGGRWLDPDGLPDNALTVVVALGAGLLVGIVWLFAFGVFFSRYGAWLAAVVWIGWTAYLARRRTVFGAVRLGAYGLAVSLVGGPALVALGSDGTVVGRAVALAVITVPTGVFALALVVGYLAGRKRVE